VNTLNEFEASMIERVSRVEETVKDHKRRIENQEDQNETLITMSVLLKNMEDNNKKRDEYQKERDEQQNAQMKEFSSTMKGVNENLTELNSGYRDLNQRVGNIEGSKWSWDDLFKKILPSVVATLVGAYLLYQFGLK